jgi:hypothetical protein
MVGDEPDRKMATTVKITVEAGDTTKSDPRGSAGPLAQRAQAEG